MRTTLPALPRPANRAYLMIVALLAAFASACLVAVLTPGTASASVHTNKIVSAWRNDTPVYQQPGAGVLSADDVQALSDQIQDPNTTTPIFVAALPQHEVKSGGRQLVAELARAYGKPGTFITLGTGSIRSYSTVLPHRIDRLTNDAIHHGGKSPFRITSQLIDDVAEAAKSAPRTRQPESSGASALGVLLVGVGFVAVIALAGGLVAVSARRKRRQRDEADFAAVSTTAEEDVTRLGEDITQLDLDVQERDLDPHARADYASALDAYDHAKASLDAARRPPDLRQVSEALEDGRYAMTCVRARLDGEPVPERRAPCFFNPQHGPSVTDRSWAPINGSPRNVPVCAADADRLDRGEQPIAREVTVDGVRRPYWEAGPAYAPWYGGYYGAYGMDGLLTGMLLGSVMTGGWGGFGLGGFGDFGGGDFGDGGFGGGDFGDGGFGGGDFGDFGGGDF